MPWFSYLGKATTNCVDAGSSSFRLDKEKFFVRLVTREINIQGTCCYFEIGCIQIGRNQVQRELLFHFVRTTDNFTSCHFVILFFWSEGEVEGVRRNVMQLGRSKGTKTSPLETRRTKQLMMAMLLCDYYKEVAFIFTCYLRVMYTHIAQYVQAVTRESSEMGWECYRL